MRKSYLGNYKYNAGSIKSLDGIEHVRLRPSLYIGDIGLIGLHQLIAEVIDNSIDEAISGYCNNISVIINTDNSISVIDNGRGIPIDYHKPEDKSALEVVMTKIGAGGKFDKKSYKISGGLHGVGISCVNALSSKMIAKVYRNGYIYYQEYSRGKSRHDVKIIDKTTRIGTEIRFWPDKSIFKKISYNYETLSNRLRELSFLNKYITIDLTDHRTKVKEIYYSKEGLKDFINYIGSNKESIIEHPIYIKVEKANVKVEIIMKYNYSFKEKIYSYVNNIRTKEGGTHLTGFRRALTITLKKYAEESGHLDNIEITGDDFREGLTAIISIHAMNPQFEGQTKTKLGNNEVSGIVEKIVRDGLNQYLDKYPQSSKKIIEKVLLSAKSRKAANKARELIHKKNPIIMELPGKLSDCSSFNPKINEIYLVEGDSAGGTAKQGRDREFQAILPLKGKILNVEKAMQYKVLANEEIKNIYTALGVHIGTEYININKLRYNKIIIMTDADIDGSHISTLILTFIFRYMKILIENGYVYIATPPLYLIRKNNQYAYAWNNEEQEKIINKFGSKGITIQRYKGLGEMNAIQLWETTMNPKSRILRKVTIENAKEADRIFSMLMGPYVPTRRDFINKYAYYANIDF
jgi:DNA gyrase subunit B